MLHVVFSISRHVQSQKVAQAVQLKFLLSPVAHVSSTCSDIFVAVHVNCVATANVAAVCSLRSHKTST